MKFEPSIATVEATRVVHDLAKFVLVTVEDRVHCIEGSVFDLFFRPHFGCEDTPQPGAVAMPAPEDCAAALEEIRQEIEPAVQRNARPMRKPKVIEKKTPKTSVPADNLGVFPPQLRHPLAASSRRVWMCLKANGPADLSTICTRLGSEESSPISNALFNMRRKGLVEAPPQPGGAWSVA